MHAIVQALPHLSLTQCEGAGLLICALQRQSFDRSCAVLQGRCADMNSPQGEAMRPRISSAIWALLITAISVAGYFHQLGHSSSGQRLAQLAFLPALPAMWAVAFLGLGHGPDGFPNDTDVLPHILTFLLWWGVIHGARIWWRAHLRARRGAEGPRD